MSDVSPSRVSRTGAEDLDPEVGLLDDEDEAVVVDSDTGGSTELPRTGAGLAPLGLEATVGAEALDAVVRVVGDEDGAVAGDGDPLGPDTPGAELPFVAAAAPHLPRKSPSALKRWTR